MMPIRGEGPVRKYKSCANDPESHVSYAASKPSAADAAAAKNELLQAKRQQAAVHLDRINAEAEHATQGYHQAWEVGDAAKIADWQRQIASLEVQRNNAQVVAEQLNRTQPLPIDPGG